jgi:hypothetical protein
MAELRVGAGDGQPIDAPAGRDTTGSNWFVLIADRGGVGAVPAGAAACLEVVAVSRPVVRRVSMGERSAPVARSPAPSAIAVAGICIPAWRRRGAWAVVRCFGCLEGVEVSTRGSD